MWFIGKDKVVKANFYQQNQGRTGLKCHNKRAIIKYDPSLSFPLTIPFYNDMVGHTTYCDYMPRFQGGFSRPRWISLQGSRSCPPLNSVRCFSGVTWSYSPCRAKWTFIHTFNPRGSDSGASRYFNWHFTALGTFFLVFVEIKWRWEEHGERLGTRAGSKQVLAFWWNLPFFPTSSYNQGF